MTIMDTKREIKFRGWHVDNPIYCKQERCALWISSSIHIKDAGLKNGMCCFEVIALKGTERTER